MEDAWRFVVLRHSGVEPEHFDLMIQMPGREKLMTWRVVVPLERWGGEIGAVRIADHRAAYMTYEGEVSGGRGSVKRVAEGMARLLRERETEWRIQLLGVVLSCEVIVPRSWA